MKSLVLSLIAASTICSCSFLKENRNNVLFGEVMDLQGQDTFINYTLDTLNVEYQNGYKIIHYVDSVGCIDCKIGFSSWEKLALEIDSFTNAKVPILIYIHPSSFNEAFFAMERAYYTRPVCIDMTDEFRRRNMSIFENDIKTFLLDDQNRIVLIGNPNEKLKIKQLYIRTICERLGIERPTEQAEPLRVSNSLGVFNWQTEQHTSFVVNNDSDEPMHIDSLYTSCECTTASINKADIAPHDKAIVNVTFKADRPEQFMREIYADLRGGEQIVMVIEGEAIE